MKAKLFLCFSTLFLQANIYSQNIKISLTNNTGEKLYIAAPNKKWVTANDWQDIEINDNTRETVVTLERFKDTHTQRLFIPENTNYIIFDPPKKNMSITARIYNKNSRLIQESRLDMKILLGQQAEQSITDNQTINEEKEVKETHPISDYAKELALIFSAIGLIAAHIYYD